MKIHWPDKDHPVWPVARVGFIVVALGLCLHYNYNTFDPIKDPRAMLIMALLTGSFEFFKSMVAKK